MEEEEESKGEMVVKKEDFAYVQCTFVYVYISHVLARWVQSIH